MATSHILDEDLEAYSLGRLSNTATGPAEEHLLGCAECQNRLADWDEYTQAMRAACQTFCDLPRSRAVGGDSQN